MREEEIQKEILFKISQYAKSVDETDLNLASKVWMDSDESTFIHPRGHEHGFEQIKENFYIKTMRNNFSKRNLNIFDVNMQIFKDTVIAEFYWHFVAQFKNTKESHETKGRETQVYIKTEDNKWRLFHVHYSNMPVTGEKEGF